MNNHVLEIDLEEEVYNILNSGVTEEIKFTPEKMDKIIEKVKEYIYEDDSFWNKLDSCVIDAIYYYVRRRRNKIDE